MTIRRRQSSNLIAQANIPKGGFARVPHKAGLNEDVILPAVLTAEVAREM
jgi:hypothetical protein